MFFPWGCNALISGFVDFFAGFIKGGAMKKILFILLFLLCANLSPAADRVALVIGNSDYGDRDARLFNPGNDADDMAKKLKRLGFTVIKKKNCTRTQFDDALDTFSRKLGGASVSFFFYSGHGMELEKINYLVPVDADFGAERLSAIRSGNLKLDEVLETMRDSNARFNIAVIDACRDNPYPRTRGVRRKLARVEPFEGTIVAYGTSSKSRAGDGRGRNGVYTTELLKNIDKPGMSMFEIFRRTGVAVKKATKNRQRPQLSYEPSEPFYLVPADPFPVPEPSPSPQPVPRPPQPAKTYTDQVTGMKFVLIPPGSFLMGSPENEPGHEDDEKQHRVTLSEGFYMGRYEVTQAQWKAVMGENPSSFKNCGSNCPVESVSWNDVQKFIKKLNAKSGKAYRLPTEAEWEYACRAGSTKALYNGPIQILGKNNAPALDPIAWYGGNSGVSYAGAYDSSGWSEKQYDHNRAGTHPVGKKEPNAWGLYDMIGNVWEWCQDWYGDYPDGAVVDPEGAGTGSGRVIRGGGWDSYARHCRSAYRGYDSPSNRRDYSGFRLVLPVGQQVWQAGSGRR